MRMADVKGNVTCDWLLLASDSQVSHLRSISADLCISTSSFHKVLRFRELFPKAADLFVSIVQWRM